MERSDYDTVNGLMRNSTFRDMRFAPKDSTPIEVRHGPDQDVVLAEWSGQAQAWILVDDPHRKTLHRVTGWRPVNQKSEGKAVSL